MEMVFFKKKTSRLEKTMCDYYVFIPSEKSAAAAAACRGSQWWLELEGHGLPWM